MRYAREAWDAERASWRSVIQLNLIRSILTIVEILQAEMDGKHPESDNPPLDVLSRSPVSIDHRASISTTGDRGDLMPKKVASSGLSSLLTDEHQLLRLRLGPLRRVETDLKRRLGAPADEEGVATSPWLDVGSSQVSPQHKKEFYVRRLTEALAQGHGHSGMASDNVVDEVTEVIASCKDDMVALWSDRTVRMVLKNWNIRLEDSAGL